MYILSNSTDKKNCPLGSWRKSTFSTFFFPSVKEKGKFWCQIPEMSKHYKTETADVEINTKT